VCLSLPRLNVPPRYVYDEVYHAYTAAQYVEGNTDAYRWDTEPRRRRVAYEWTHPPLGKLIIAGGIRVFGDNSFGWRIASALFGAAGIVVTYALGRSITGRLAVGVVAAVLLLADGLYFADAPAGLLGIFLVVFTTGALLAFYRALIAPTDRVRGPLLATGLLLGLALATKWNAAFCALFVGLVAVWRLVRLGWESRRGGPEAAAARAGFRAHLLWVPLGLVALPAVVYLASYVPYFLVGFGWGDFVELQRQMYLYHTELDEPHEYYSRWWEWPLAIRPVWYFLDRGADASAYIYANGNPLLYWAMLPAVWGLVVEWWRRHAGLTVLLIGFFGQWLPWALSPRGAFAYHFLPSVPFGCLALGVLIVGAWRRGRWWRWLAAGYVVAVVAAFVFFYPIYAAIPLSPEAFERRLWFGSWR